MNAILIANHLILITDDVQFLSFEKSHIPRSVPYSTKISKGLVVATPAMVPFYYIDGHQTNRCFKIIGQSNG